MDFNKEKLKNWNSIGRDKNSNLVINSNLESAKTNSNLEYLTKDSTPKLIGIDFKLFKVESSCADSNSKYHYYKNGVQFISLNHFGHLKVKQVHCVLLISPWWKLFHYNIIMYNIRYMLLYDIPYIILSYFNYSNLYFMLL